MRAIQEGGQEEMQEALQLAASLMITHVTLNDLGAYYIVTELECRALLCARARKSQRRQESTVARGKCICGRLELKCCSTCMKPP